MRVFNDQMITNGTMTGTAVVAATETVSCRYTKTDATAFNGGAVRAFNIRDFDTHAAYSTSTGLFTAPVSGKYLVVASVQSAVSLYSPGQNQRLYFNANGSIVWGTEHVYSNSSSSTTHRTASTVVNLLAGQTVGVVTDGSVVNNFTVDGTRNSLSITRLGN